jgi:hypothetical protein
MSPGEGRALVTANMELDIDVKLSRAQVSTCSPNITFRHVQILSVVLMIVT